MMKKSGSLGRLESLSQSEYRHERFINHAMYNDDMEGSLAHLTRRTEQY